MLELYKLLKVNETSKQVSILYNFITYHVVIMAPYQGLQSYQGTRIMAFSIVTLIDLLRFFIVWTRWKLPPMYHKKIRKLLCKEQKFLCKQYSYNFPHMYICISALWWLCTTYSFHASYQKTFISNQGDIPLLQNKLNYISCILCDISSITSLVCDVYFHFAWQPCDINSKK